MIRIPALFLAALACLAPALAGAETVKIRVKGVGELYGEVEEKGTQLTIVTVTGEKRTFPRADVVSVQSLAEPPGGDEPSKVVDAAAAPPEEPAEEAPSPEPAAPAAAAPASAPGGSDALGALMQRIKEDPAVLAELSAIVQEDPAVREALSDPALMKAVTSGDTAAAEKSPSFAKIANNPRIQALVKRLGGEAGK